MPGRATREWSSKCARESHKRVEWVCRSVVARAVLHRRLWNDGESSSLRFVVGTFFFYNQCVLENAATTRAHPPTTVARIFVLCCRVTAAEHSPELPTPPATV